MKHLLPTNSIAVGVDDSACIVLVARDGAPIATVTNVENLIEALRTAVMIRDLMLSTPDEREARARRWGQRYREGNRTVRIAAILDGGKACAPGDEPGVDGYYDAADPDSVQRPFLATDTYPDLAARLAWRAGAMLWHRRARAERRG